MLIKNLEKSVRTKLKESGLAADIFTLKQSDRPDLSDFQSNIAMRLAKVQKRNPIDVASDFKKVLLEIGIFSEITIDGPGFLNFKMSDSFILEHAMDSNDKTADIPLTLIIDYGGPNVAKPLHVGHLRSAIIGEALKRIARHLGHNVISDIHLGDWGTPMGMLIAELRERHPEWPYFKDDFTDTGDDISPIDVDTLNSLYPVAASHFKEDPTFAQKSREATAHLQSGHTGYRALWRHFIDLSISSIKEDFSALEVDFDLWLGESDADPYIEQMITDLVERGIARESNGALVIDVKQEGDKVEIHPLIIRKSDGAATYATTDLATIFQRQSEYAPDKILYVVDKRQGLHFKQVFRAAAQAGYIENIKNLEHLGFGTMNAEDGKPFKTRDGGVMRLRDLISMAKDASYSECGYSTDANDKIRNMVERIAISAVKFGDLVNPRTSDYIFNPLEFSKFEGRTGPYIQYAAVRAKSILNKTENMHFDLQTVPSELLPSERALALTLMMFNDTVELSFERRMPHEVSLYAFELAQRFNTFYASAPIVVETDEDKKSLRISLTQKTVATLQKCFDLLAIPIPDVMKRASLEPQAAPT
jgi:arginyl-tRNA synthetase